MNIYVGNLPYKVDDQELSGIFATFGEVTSAKVIMDRETGRSKGFGFVEMSSAEDGKKAIEALDQSDYEGRPLKVNESQPKPQGGGGYRGGGGGRGYGGGGGGGGYRGGGGGRGYGGGGGRGERGGGRGYGGGGGRGGRGGDGGGDRW